MPVLYHEKVPVDPKELNSRINKWYLRLHKFWILVPIFPKDPDHADKWWYKFGYSVCFASSAWFYLLALYFIYLASASNFDWFYLIGAIICVVVGILLPAGAYKLTIYYLMRKKYIF